METLEQRMDRLCRELLTLNAHWTGRQLQADERGLLLSPEVAARIAILEGEIRRLQEAIEAARTDDLVATRRFLETY